MCWRPNAGQKLKAMTWVKICWMTNLEDALVAVDVGGGVAGVPEGLDEGGEGGMRVALEIEHASASLGRTSENWAGTPE